MAGKNAFSEAIDGALNRPTRFFRVPVRQDSRFPARDWSVNPPHGEDGQSLVEMALALPIMLAFIFGLIQVCLAFYTYEMISESAREGSRYAITHGSTCVTGTGASCSVTAASVSSYVSGGQMPNLGGGTMAVSTTFYPSGGDVPPNDYVVVTVNYTFPYRIPFIMNKSLSLTSSSEMYFIQ